MGQGPAAVVIDGQARDAAREVVVALAVESALAIGRIRAVGADAPGHALLEGGVVGRHADVAAGREGEHRQGTLHEGDVLAAGELVEAECLLEVTGTQVAEAADVLQADVDVLEVRAHVAPLSPAKSYWALKKRCSPWLPEKKRRARRNSVP